MRRILPILIVLSLMGVEPAIAQGLRDATAASDGLLILIKNSAGTWSNILRGYATNIFWSLALIQLVWTFGQLALKQSDFGEWAAETIRYIMTTGFFAALLLYSVDWAQAIIDSFRQAGAGAAGVPVQLEPGDMFNVAIELGKTIGGIGLVDPVTAVIVSLSAILVVVCFTFIAAFMMVTLIESYFVINAAVFFMAFAGSQWTREYAMAMVRYSISVGAKLFVLTLLVGLIMVAARQWQMAYTQDETSMLTMVGLSLVCAYLSKTLPDMVQGLINGVSVGGGSQLGTMAAAGVAGVAAGAAAMLAATNSGVMSGTGKSVSDLLKSTFTGGGSSGGGSSPGSFMNGGGSGGGSSGPRPTPRTGGGGFSQPGTPPRSAQAMPSGGQASSSGSQSSSSSTTPSSAASKLHTATHAATEAAVRGVGVMGSISVPGMEGAANISVGPAPVPPDLSGIGEETPGNIIRPASAPMNENVSDEVASAPIESMTDLQEAMNIRKT